MTEDKVPSQDEVIQAMEEWAERVEQQYSAPMVELNFVELSRLPKKITLSSLRSLVISETRIMPKNSEICYKSQPGCELEQVAILEYHSQQETYLVVERLRLSPWTKNWAIKVMMNPKFVDPESELVSRWIR